MAIKTYQIGFLGIVMGILAIGLSGRISELASVSERLIIGLGGINLILGASFIYFDYLLGLSKEKNETNINK